MIRSPEIQKIEGVYVVRDDLIPGGTKRVFVDQLIIGRREVVYASPVYGGAQIAIAHAARDSGVMATIFCAKRTVPHARTLESYRIGAKIVQVPTGYLSNVQSKAKKYCEQTGATLLPFGLETPVAFTAIAQRAATVQEVIGDIDQVWCVGGSGVLCRGIQNGIKAGSYHVVQVGRTLNSTNVGRAKVYIHPLKFEQNAKVLPPFPSCSNYDAKAWEYIKKHAKGRVLFWNVMK